MKQIIEGLRNDGPDAPAPVVCGAGPRVRQGGGLELAPPPEPECECRAALRRILSARDRYLAALGDGSAPFKLPEEDEYLDSLAAARQLFVGRAPR